jgi:hypothetical protein
VLDQALGFLDHHLGDLNVARAGSSKVGGDHLALHRTLHVGDFLGPLVDQQHDQITIGMVAASALAMFCRITVLPVRAARDEGALAHAQGRDDVDDAAGLVFDGWIASSSTKRLVG